MRLRNDVTAAQIQRKKKGTRKGSFFVQNKVYSIFMQRMFFSILIFFLFFSYATAADSCRTSSKKVHSEWVYVGKELVVVNGKTFELNVKKNEQRRKRSTNDTDEIVATYTKFNEDYTGRNQEKVLIRMKSRTNKKL